MKISIRLALFISFLAVIWGTFLLTTTSTRLTSEQTLEDHVHVIMENISSYAMEQSQNYLSKAQRAAQLTKRLLRSEVLVQNNGRALENYFLEQLVTYPDISGIYFGAPNGDFFFVSRNDKYSPDGIRTKIISHRQGQRQVSYRFRDAQHQLVAEEDDPNDSYDPRARPWYQGALATDSIFWSDPYIFYTSQKPGITISGPTYDAEGNLRGIVGVDIEIDQLSTFIAKLRIGEHGRAFMLNRNRDVVAFHDVEKIKHHQQDGRPSSRLVKIDEFSDPLCRAAFRALGVAQEEKSQIQLSHAEYTRFEVDGENYQAMFVPFPDPQWPWVIGMYMPEDDYLGALKMNRVVNVLVTFVISLFASILILFIARSIARPVLGLRRYAEDIARGNFTNTDPQETPVSLFREVSETAARFDALMAELEESRQQQQRTAESLRRKEDQYSSLVENLKVGVFRVGLNGEFFSANRALIEMFGCSSLDELKQFRSVDFYCDPWEREQLIATLKVQRQVSNWDFQAQPRGKKDPIWVSLTCRILGEDPDCSIEGVLEDITERKHSEEMLILSERMAAVGTLASGVAHEFNNIHTGVLGYAELGGRIDGLPERARSCFETIRNSSLRARDLTANLLSCSNRQSIKLVPADLNMTIRESFSLVEREFLSDGIELKTDFGEIPEFMMDRAQIGQVILNLLINARHALIGRTQKRIRVSSGVSGKHAWVRVEDSGCGISAENLKNIFTPFFSTKGEYARADSPQAVVRGSGLGLAVCHTIAKNHSGRIEVDSQIDSGSSFTLWLPVRERMSEDIGLKIEYPKFFTESQPGGRILVIDDEPNIRDLIGQTLIAQGYEVVTTDDGAEGLRIIRAEGVDLVLVDIQMPKMKGTDFLRQLQSVPAEDRPLALIVTGKIEEAGLNTQYGLEVYATLAKPFVLDELQSLVHAAMLQRQAHPEGLRAERKVLN